MWVVVLSGARDVMLDVSVAKVVGTADQVVGTTELDSRALDEAGHSGAGGCQSPTLVGAASSMEEVIVGSMGEGDGTGTHTSGADGEGTADDEGEGVHSAQLLVLVGCPSSGYSMSSGVVGEAGGGTGLSRSLTGSCVVVVVVSVVVTGGWGAREGSPMAVDSDAQGEEVSELALVLSEMGSGAGGFCTGGGGIGSRVGSGSGSTIAGLVVVVMVAVVGLGAGVVEVGFDVVVVDVVSLSQIVTVMGAGCPFVSSVSPSTGTTEMTVVG